MTKKDQKITLFMLVFLGFGITNLTMIKPFFVGEVNSTMNPLSALKISNPPIDEIIPPEFHLNYSFSGSEYYKSYFDTNLSSSVYKNQSFRIDIYNAFFEVDESNLISNILWFPDYAIIQANFTYFANVPVGTTIECFLSNNNLFEKYPVSNNSFVDFTRIGRQLAFEIVLRTEDTSVTPSFNGFSIDAKARYLENLHYYEPKYNKIEISKLLYHESLGENDFGSMKFDLKMRGHPINSTSTRLDCNIRSSYLKGSFYAGAIYSAFYNANITINGILYGFHGKASFTIPRVSTGYLGDWSIFSPIISHANTEIIYINGTIECKAIHTVFTRTIDLKTKIYQTGEGLSIPVLIGIGIAAVTLIGVSIKMKKHS